MSLITIQNLHIHCDLEKLDRILAGQADIKEKIMSLKDDFDAALAKIDDATNAVSARLDRLSQQITNSMTDAQVADVKAKLAAESDRLSAMGKDPENPTPVPEPTPTP